MSQISQPVVSGAGIHAFYDCFDFYGLFDCAWVALGVKATLFI